jgi:hypothetical protein
MKLFFIPEDTAYTLKLFLSKILLKAELIIGISGNLSGKINLSLDLN